MIWHTWAVVNTSMLPEYSRTHGCPVAGVMKALRLHNLASAR